MTPTNKDIVRAKEWLKCLNLRSDISLGEDGYKWIKTAIEIISAYEQQGKSNEEIYQKGRRVEIERYEKELALLKQALAKDTEEIVDLVEKNKQQEVTIEDLRDCLLARDCYIKELRGALVEIRKQLIGGTYNTSIGRVLDIVQRVLGEK